MRAVQVYIASNFQQASFLQPKGETFREFLDQQGIFVFFVTIYVGAGLIAADRRANALQLYLSKPLTRWEYVAGKLAILFVFLVLVTFVPAMTLLLVQIGFAGSLTFVRQNLYLVPAITLFSLVQVLLASCTILALSSLSNSSRFVGIMYAGLDLLHRRAVQRRARHHRPVVAGVAVADRRARAARRRDLPAAAALRSPGVGGGAGGRRRSSAGRCWCWSAACARSRWCADEPSPSSRPSTCRSGTARSTA